MVTMLLFLRINNSVNKSIETMPQFAEVKYPGIAGIVPRWSAHRGPSGAVKLGKY